MKDINLNSKVLNINSMPKETNNIMVLYDERGWAIRCYDENGHKLTTLIPDLKMGDSHSDVTLQPQA